MYLGFFSVKICNIQNHKVITKVPELLFQFLSRSTDALLRKSSYTIHASAEGLRAKSGSIESAVLKQLHKGAAGFKLV